MPSDVITDARTKNYHYKHRATRAKSIQLAARDYDLLAAIHTYRVLHRGHIHDLFFTGLKDEGGSARRRLSQLYNHGYLERIPRFITPPNFNPGPAYRLAARGAGVLADRGHTPLRDFNYWGKTEDYQRRSPKLGHAYVEHNLMLTDIRLAFERQARDARCSIEHWLDYHDLRPSWSTERVRVAVAPAKPTEDLAIAPDGYVVLRTEKGRGHFFFEADRGTETIDRQWRRKILAYKAYLSSGKFHARYNVEPHVRYRVLIVTLLPTRATSIRQASERFGDPDLANLFLVTSMVEMSLIQSVWLRGGLAEPVSII